MKDDLFNYDHTNLESVINYSQNLVNAKLSDIINKYKTSKYKSYTDFMNKTDSVIDEITVNYNSKGQYGNYIEKYFYGYHPNSDSNADFAEIGVELKVTPFKINKNGTISAKERLVLSVLNYMEENLDDFYQTHLWKKCQKILLLFYNGLIPNATLEDYFIEKVFLFEWFDEDMEVILEDYNRIAIKIKEGNAHMLSESDGNYLSTCTKGAGKGRDFRKQPFSDIPAKQRAWELKSSYMTYLINNKIFNSDERESIVSNFKGEKTSFTKVVESQILKYKGVTESKLYEIFSVPIKSKNRNSLLIRRILGLTGDIENTQEFKKANMNLRVIRVKKNGIPKEDSPFKTYSFNELALNDRWEDSHPFLEIANKRFLFVVFQEDELGQYRLEKIKFWGFPDIHVEEIKRVWQETREIIKDGIHLNVKENNKGTYLVSTNFPQSSINKIIFTKIHASNTYYEIKPNEFIGKGSLSDTDKLPDGRRITKHSFWMPKKYLAEILSGKWD